MGRKNDRPEQKPKRAPVHFLLDDVSLIELEDELRVDLQEEYDVSASVWRSWSEHAAPYLVEAFNEATVPCLRKVRSKYPGNVTPDHPQYLDLRRDCVNALNRLSEQIQGDADAFDQSEQPGDGG